MDAKSFVRVFLLDGSSKVFSMPKDSLIADLLLSLKGKMDLVDISCFAIVRVSGSKTRLCGIKEEIVDVLDRLPDEDEVRLLFRSWIFYEHSAFFSEVFQYSNRIKEPTIALWLAYLESIFMTWTGRYFLTEDESILLGCIKMQTESGNYNPNLHDVALISTRVSTRFPEPIRSRMKALSSSTLAGSKISDDLAKRVILVYARLAGKSKVESQIDYLTTLRIYCPFFGSTFFETQCQYDENPLQDDSTPPTVPMRAIIGPSSIVLANYDDPPVMLRHPYEHIVKWSAHPDKDIFTYWALKPSVDMESIEISEDKALVHCDCIYLVSAQVGEIGHLVESYVNIRKNIPPALPDAYGDLLPPQSSFKDMLSSKEAILSNEKDLIPKVEESSANKGEGKTLRRRLSSFFGGVSFNNSSSTSSKGNAAFTASSSSLAGLFDAAPSRVESQKYSDDTAGVTSSVFATALSTTSNNKRDNKHYNPSYASNFSTLQRMASKVNFSDSEGSSEDGGGEEDSEEEERHEKDSESSEDNKDAQDSNENEHKDKTSDINKCNEEGPDKGSQLEVGEQSETSSNISGSNSPIPNRRLSLSATLTKSNRSFRRASLVAKKLSSANI